jgi:pimeloyl-ACP methyl ester carboxylesterase
MSGRIAMVPRRARRADEAFSRSRGDVTLDARPVLPAIERGSGKPTLVFLHYFGGSSADWDLVADRLAPGFRCLLPDLRGFGAAAADDVPPTWSVADAADDVAALIAAHAVDDFVLVGHSMGGKIALALAARELAGLRRVVLVAPSPPTPEPIDDNVRARLLATHGERAAAQESAGEITFQPQGSPLFERVVADNLATAPGVWRAWLETGSREDISEAVKRIAVPVLAVSGAEDRTIPTTVIAREVVARVPGAKLIEVAGSRHLVPFDRPEELSRLIADFARPIAPGPS